MNDTIRKRVQNILDQARELFDELERLRLTSLQDEGDSPTAEALLIDLGKLAAVADDIEALL